jgi:hypothetical protein
VTAPAAPPQAAGRIVEGPENIAAFNPADTTDTARVDLDRLSLRRVFEEMGPESTLWYQHVQTLANEYFEGRANGSAGSDRTRDYIEFYFRKYGLEPAFPENESADASAARTSYRQPFTFDERRVEVTVTDADATAGGDALREGADFAVMGNSASGSARGPLTFVGYAIAEGPDGYTSFDEGTDLTGRIALLLRYEPLDESGGSRWAETRFSPRASLAPKLQALVDRHAAGIILVNPPGARDGAEGLEQANGRFGRQLEVPCIQVTPDVADAMVRRADPAGGDLMSWRRRADEGSVRTVSFDDAYTVAFSASVERLRVSVPAANVGAVLPGAGTLADEWLVIGGHFDHNGYGNFGDDPGDGPLHPGADDNASGTAGILILAKRFAEDYARLGPDTDRRSILFIAFDAEERGLHGSRHYSESPSVPPEKTTAMLNMDMIGRLRADNLSALGVATGAGLEAILRPHFEASGLTVSVNGAGSSRSDDANFRRISIPAIHFFTGMHDEYHQPGDFAHTVNPVGAGKVLDLIYDIGADLASRSERLVYAEPARGGRGENRQYARVRFGIRPGMGDDLETGILVDEVSEGTSADLAGIRAGDVLLTWDGAELDELRSLFELLQEKSPGDEVKITLRRDGAEQTVTVKLLASTDD